MIESPLIQEIVERTRQEVLAESSHKGIVRILRTRFREVPEELAAAVNRVADAQLLDQLFEYAVVCPDIKAFQARLGT